jgi:uncharacterized membrane protein YheB (UPF0754 family)
MIFRVVLPQRKGDIAKAIQDVVSKELLSPDKIADKFASAGMRDPLRRNVGQWLDGLLDKDLPSWIELTEAKRGEFAPREAALLREIVDALFNTLSGDDFREFTIQPFLARNWRENQQKSVADIAPALPAAASSWLSGALCRLAEDGDSHDRISRFLTSLAADKMRAAKILGDLATPQLRDMITELTTEQAPIIVELLASALEKTEAQRALVAIVEKALKDNMSSSSGLAGHILAIVAEHVADVKGFVERLPELVRGVDRREVEAILRRSAADLWREDWRKVLGDMSADRLHNGFAVLLKELLQPDHIEAAGRFIDGWCASIASRRIGDLAATIPGFEHHPDMTEKIARAIQAVIVSPQARAAVDERLTLAIAVARAAPIGKLGRFADSVARERITETICEMVVDTVHSRLAVFVEQSGIWNIVGESIESFDDKRLEKIVRGIANRELAWVTALGGILGAVIGVVQAYFQPLLMIVIKDALESLFSG